MFALSRQFSGRSRKLLFGLSPWLVIGLSLVLGLAILALSLRSSEREARTLTSNLVNRAEALIWALEAGTRTWMGFQGESRLLQQLVEETAKQPGILYLAVAANDGRIIAHSDPGRVGGSMAKDRPPPGGVSGTPAWRIVKDPEKSVFEVYRRFAPVRPAGEPHAGHHLAGMGGWGMDMGRHAGGMWNRVTSPDGEKAYENSVVYVGLDHQPYEEAIQADSDENALTAALVAALGLGGFVSLFWAHNYRHSNRLLMDTRALASEVITNLPVGLMTSDPEGRLGIVNGAALDMLRPGGAPPPESLGGVPGLDWLALASALDRGDRILERETELALPDGRRAPVSLSASRIATDDGSFLGHLFILRDLGEVKRLREEVERNERLTALGTLAAGVAHEIRNPLSSIKGLAAYLAGKAAPGGREEEAAKTMVAEANRLNRVVSELLEFARPGAGPLAPSDLNEAIRRALRLAEADLRSKDIRVDFAADPSLPLVPLNGERFVQALLNLFLNAVQAMDRGGELRVAAAAPPGGDGVVLTVADNGQGMPAATLSSLFTPYFTTKPNGTGLGLPIVRQIVEGHGGRIKAESEPGRGSVFTITLPPAKRQ